MRKYWIHTHMYNFLSCLLSISVQHYSWEMLNVRKEQDEFLSWSLFWFPFLLISSNPKQSINTLKSTVQIVSLLQEPNVGVGFWCCLVVFPDGVPVWTVPKSPSGELLKNGGLTPLRSAEPSPALGKRSVSHGAEVREILHHPRIASVSAYFPCCLVVVFWAYGVSDVGPTPLKDWSGMSLMGKSILGAHFAGVTRLQGPTGNTWAKKGRRIRLELVFYNHRVIFFCSIISHGIAKIFFLR